MTFLVGVGVLELSRFRPGDPHVGAILASEQKLLEQFANPQDEYEEIDPEDAHLDLQIRNFRDLAKLNLYSAIF